MRIAIVVPSGDMVHAEFAFSLIRLTQYTYQMRGDIEFCVINSKSSLVQKGRWQGVKQALSVGADKILFIDSDQTFPHDALTQLLKSDMQIVGATCCKRVEPHEWTAKVDGRTLSKSAVGLIEVDTNGFPFCLIDTQVFRDIPEDLWFQVHVNKGKWMSEDESFCIQAAIRGYPIVVDADLSKQIGHIGTKIFI